MDRIAANSEVLNEEEKIDSEILELILPHKKAMYVRALQLCQDPDLAEDLVQDTFFLGIKYIYQIKDRSKSKFWLAMILKNQFFKECAKNKRVEYWGDSELAENRVDEKLPEDDLLEREKNKEAMFLIEELEDHLRTPLKLFHLKKLSYKEIAFKMRVPMGTVMSRISRARRHLRKKYLDCQELKN